MFFHCSTSGSLVFWSGNPIWGINLMEVCEQQVALKPQLATSRVITLKQAIYTKHL